MVIMVPPLTLISIVKPKRGVGSHVEKGWDPPGPTASHRARFGSHIEKSWDPPGPTEPDLGPIRREELKSWTHRVPPAGRTPGLQCYWAVNRVPPSPIWVPRKKELGPTGSHQFGSHRREELGPTGSRQVRIGTRARLVVLRARFWVQKMLMLPASTLRASIVL